MRSFYFALLLAPTAVLSVEININPGTGELCCDQGTPDSSESCKGLGLNSYCVSCVKIITARSKGKKINHPSPHCSQARNDNRGGCDPPRIEIFNVGRTVTSFVQGGTCKRTDSQKNVYNAFIGCAKWFGFQSANCIVCTGICSGTCLTR